MQLVGTDRTEAFLRIRASYTEKAWEDGQSAAESDGWKGISGKSENDKTAGRKHETE